MNNNTRDRIMRATTVLVIILSFSSAAFASITGKVTSTLTLEVGDQINSASGATSIPFQLSEDAPIKGGFDEDSKFIVMAGFCTDGYGNLGRCWGGVNVF